jgi:nicotinate-nucleotide pyrophosphorylase (carboxylating)
MYPVHVTFELNAEDIRRQVAAALAEDRAEHDVTTSALVPPGQQGRAVLQAKTHGVLAGLVFARAPFDVVDPTLRWTEHVADGDRLIPGQTIATVEGALASILRAERVALNYICHLSGVATTAADVVRQLTGTNCRLRDTRKTIPGLRLAEKYAARMGGAENHRLDLADGVLVKDNHIAALRHRDLGVTDAVRLAREAKPGLKIEIEVTSLAEAREAAEAGADELLLDNMTPEECATVVRDLDRLGKRPILEASGGITTDNVRAYAESGVDYISMGAITHSAPALDLSLEVEPD